MKGLLSSLLCCTVLADFIFSDFNITHSIQFNGITTTSSCEMNPEYWYIPSHGSTDDLDTPLITPISETETEHVQEFVDTDVYATSRNISRDTAIFSHRDAFLPKITTGCPNRVRLTPSLPNVVGSMWYELSLPVEDGFECGFTFQISDHSRSCTVVKSPNLISNHQSCRVHGGDGFAFVIQGDERGYRAIGSAAEKLGFGGIKNGIAIEFDTWYNPDINDPVDDHVTIYTNGQGVLDTHPSQRIAGPYTHAIADGLVHKAVVKYYPRIATELLSSFSATSELLQYIVDNDEKRRVGTLAVWLDDDGAMAPTIAIPINLSRTINLQQNEAFVGFTASTGRYWEKHDILSWYCCENPPCDFANTFNSDYAQQSEVYNTEARASDTGNDVLLATDGTPEGIVEILRPAHTLGA